ncbi:MAG: hypothetical protein MZV63_60620 [Marinilabiliales bacterium]|nr:hypothetical protein [Marinilabiliales bacterium]
MYNECIAAKVKGYKMLRKPLLLLSILSLSVIVSGQGWIRINQLGYLPESVKVAVFISTRNEKLSSFSLNDALTGKPVFTGNRLFTAVQNGV